MTENNVARTGQPPTGSIVRGVRKRRRSRSACASPRATASASSYGSTLARAPPMQSRWRRPLPRARASPSMIRRARSNHGVRETVVRIARGSRRRLSVADDRTRLALHALPSIGLLPIADDRAALRLELKKLVHLLGARALAVFTKRDGKRSPFAPRTALPVWTVVCALFRDACRAKDRACASAMTTQPKAWPPTE